MSNKRFKRAFTLSEILVTLGILGVLGLLSLGLLRGNTAELEQKVARAKLMDSVSTALATMQLDGKIAGYANTGAFANEFQNYYNVNEVLTGADATAVLDAGAAAGAIGTANAADYFVFTGDGGATVALSYNKNGVALGQFTESSTTADRGTGDIEFRNSALSFVDGFYDVNGIDKGANKLGKDIGALAAYDDNTAACKGNFVPVSGGSCICSITANECLALGKKLDSKKCECTGEVSCQMGKTYNETTKKCECPVESRNCDSVYSVFDEATCTCKVDLKTQLTCKANGGTWNATKGTCECLPADDENSCESKYHGYATADQADYCKCKCKSASDIAKKVAQNAQGKGNTSVITKYTLANNDLSQECFYCGAPDTTAFSLKKSGSVCVPESKNNPEDCVGDGFLQWVDYNPNDEKNSYYCKCVLTQAKCDTVFKNALETQYGKGFVPRSNTCYGESAYYPGGSPKPNFYATSCKYNEDKCRENPYSAECRNTVKYCNVSGNAPTSTAHYTCAKNYWGGTKPVNGSLKAMIPNSTTHATKNSCYCAPQNGVLPNIPSPYQQYDFHNKFGIYESNKFYTFKGYGVNVAGAYADNRTATVQNAVVFENYTNVYDPIILNVAASNATAAPEATDVIATKFKLAENAPITTAWLKKQTKPEFYFLVNDRNLNGQVDDLNDLYHEGGGAYFTGLDMLKAEGFTFDKNDAGETNPIITYPQLANKGLKAWADMNADAKVDGTETLVDLLKLQASEIEYFIEEKRTVTKEIPNPDYVEPTTKKHNKNSGESGMSAYIPEAPSAPEYEVFATPAPTIPSDGVVEPEEDTTVPEDETVVEPEEDTTVPEDETVVEPEDETVTEPEDDTTATPEEEPVKEGEGAAQPEDETPAEPETPVVEVPKTITVTEEEIIQIPMKRLAFTNISGLGVFEINTAYQVKSGTDGDGRPLVLGHETIAIQGRYSILKPISGLDSSKYWIEIMPVAVGENPEIKYIAKDALDTSGIAAGEEVYRTTTVNGLDWTETFRDAAGSEIRAGKDIGIFLKVEQGDTIKYYELTVRGLTDVLFENTMEE